jgi:hypothetical protein
MKKTIITIALLGGFVSTAMAAGSWHGDYTVHITGQDTMLTKAPAVRQVSDTTTMNIKEIGDNVTITFGSFAGVSSATVFKGMVGNEKICANWWDRGSSHQTKVIWGDRQTDGTIRGSFLYPRTAGKLVPGWLFASFRATKKVAINPSVIHPSGLHRSDLVKPQNFQNRGIDPAAYQIKFDIVRRDSQFSGLIRVTGIVKNVGQAAYVDPRHGAGAIRMFRGQPFTNEFLVKRADLRDLKPGDEQKIVYERPWNSSSSSEGEFPPTFWLDIGYDPDITLDSCPTNDDCNVQNNRISASGMAINDLFRSTTGTTISKPLQPIKLYKPNIRRKY